jgi:hypothetical protein
VTSNFGLLDAILYNEVRTICGAMSAASIFHINLNCIYLHWFICRIKKCRWGKTNKKSSLQIQQTGGSIRVEVQSSGHNSRASLNDALQLLCDYTINGNPSLADIIQFWIALHTYWNYTNSSNDNRNFSVLIDILVF